MVGCCFRSAAGVQEQQEQNREEQAARPKQGQGVMGSEECCRGLCWIRWTPLCSVLVKREITRGHLSSEAQEEG